MTESSFIINGQPVGSGEPTYVVAELSGNHNQSKERALALIDAAAEAEADAVKLQTYKPETLTIDCEKEPFVVEGDNPWEDRTLWDLYEEAHTPWDWQPELKEYAEARGLDCFSTPFDESAVEFLKKMDVPAYKIASFEITHLPLIRTIAQQGKPVIMSTGMATMAEIDEAVRTARENGDPPLALMHCNSAYPARPEEMDLATIPHMMDGWDVPVGLSDHTLGPTSAVAAVTLGASMVEKHLTLDRSEGGPDAEFSMEPQEFSNMVDQIRLVEKARGRVRYGCSESEAESLLFRESIFAVKDIPKGGLLSSENIKVIRPGHGIEPKHIGEVQGSKAAEKIERGVPVTWEKLE
jgi:N-acetylneuraminate synthase